MHLRAAGYLGIRDYRPRHTQYPSPSHKGITPNKVRSGNHSAEGSGLEGAIQVSAMSRIPVMSVISQETKSVCACWP